MSLEGFFSAAAAVAGGLIGLLFVAVSMLRARLAEGEETPIHRAQAAATLTALANALTVSLMALIPGDKVGWAAVIDACGGLALVILCALNVAVDRETRWRDATELFFLFVLAAAFLGQLFVGFDLLSKPTDTGALSDLALVVVACFVVGVNRAWQLVGGPPTRAASLLIDLVRPLVSRAATKPEA
jgi:lysylphosphatidylglycerol synthetase-like protein (DUF2156 family)